MARGFRFGDGNKVRIPVSGQCPPQADAQFDRKSPPRFSKQFGDVLANAGEFESRMDLEFSWSASGEAIYFERAFRGARNLWKMSVDPNTLKATAIERLTTGPEYDTRLALSPDGRKLAFTGGTRRIRAWLFPFDATRGRLRGPGQAVTSPGVKRFSTRYCARRSAVSKVGSCCGLVA